MLLNLSFCCFFLSCIIVNRTFGRFCNLLLHLWALCSLNSSLITSNNEPFVSRHLCITNHKVGYTGALRIICVFYSRKLLITLARIWLELARVHLALHLKRWFCFLYPVWGVVRRLSLTDQKQELCLYLYKKSALFNVMEILDSPWKMRRERWKGLNKWLSR